MAEWVNIDEVAKHLKLPKPTLYRLVRKAGLPGYKLGRSYRFDLDEVDRWVKQRGVKELSPKRQGGQS